MPPRPPKGPKDPKPKTLCCLYQPNNPNRARFVQCSTTGSCPVVNNATLINTKSVGNCTACTNQVNPFS